MRARARGAPAVLVADHRPVLPRDGVVAAQVAQSVVRIVVVVPVLVAVVPAPALEPYAKREAVSCGAVCTQGLDGFGFRTLFSSRRREGYRPVVESSLPACTKSNHRL